MATPWYLTPVQQDTPAQHGSDSLTSSLSGRRSTDQQSELSKVPVQNFSPTKGIRMCWSATEQSVPLSPGLSGDKARGSQTEGGLTVTNWLWELGNKFPVCYKKKSVKGKVFSWFAYTFTCTSGYPMLREMEIHSADGYLGHTNCLW